MGTPYAVVKSREAWRKANNIDDKDTPISRIWEMPRKWTFQQPKLRAWVEGMLEGMVLNMFGGVTQLTYPEHLIHTNDINEAIPANLRRDAYDLNQWAGSAGEYDTVIFDPPYSSHQAVVSYEGRGKHQLVTHARDVVEYVLKPEGRVISLGWNSTGMSQERLFKKEAILLVNHGGSHNDTIVMVERRVP